MNSLLEQPSVGQAHSSTLDDFNADAILQDGGFDLEGSNNVDFGQYLNDFDSDGNPLNEPNTDPIIQNNKGSPIAAAEVDTENSNLPAVVAAIEDLYAPVLPEPEKRDQPAVTATMQDLITPASEPAVENAASTAIATHADCTITPGDLLSDYQSPPSESTSFFPGPTPVTWNPTIGTQPRYNSFRPVSAPPMGMYDPYDQVSLERHYDQFLELPDYVYPDDRNGRCYPSNAARLSGRPIANMDKMASYPYQQTSISYPGSPNQPIDPALMANGYFGPPGMPRQVHHYYPLPNPHAHNAAAMFNYRKTSASKPEMQRPPRSNLRKHTLHTSEDGGFLDPKRQRIHDWMIDTKAARGLSRPHQPFQIPLQARKAATRRARSVVALTGSPNPDVDVTKAVTLATRRNRNPGRKNTIPQTAAVIRRNRIRRERYRESLTPQKRKQYDFNASVAKGLITLPSEEEAEDDTVHDPEPEKLSGDADDRNGDEFGFEMP